MIGRNVERGQAEGRRFAVGAGRIGLVALVAAGALAACGGTADDVGAGPIGFDSAPALSPAPPQLPVVNDMNVCQDHRVGDRDLENLEVPDGARCVLESGVRVDGNVELGTGSELYAQGVHVGGNVQGQRARVVVLEGSTVGGSVQLELGGAITLDGNEVGGSIQLKENGGAIWVHANRVDSDVQLFENVGGAEVRANTVDGNLQCKENAPPPAGGANVVQGNKEDQCAPL